LTIAGYIWTSDQDYAGPFIQNHVPFNLYRNVLWPEIGMSLMIYLCYMWVNLFITSGFLFPKKIVAGTSKMSLSFKKISFEGMGGKILKKFLWLIIQLFLIGFLLGSALTVSTYYKHEWLFHYPGFTFIPPKGHSTGSLINIYGMFLMIWFLVVVYFLYTCFRQLIIRFIERSGERRPYRIMIFNQFTGFLVIFFIPFSFLYAFEFPWRGDVAAYYFSFVVPGFLLFMINTYWLFPSKGQSSFFNAPFISRLILLAVILVLPFYFPLSNQERSLNGGHSNVFFYLIFSQLLIVTPVSWLLYQQRKEKILKFRGLETALVKSKTDLQFLRSQINPHFLFNILNTLYGTALQEKAEKTASGIQKLGDMMRFMLHENNLDFIQMNREIEYLKNYIALQKLRTQSSPQIIIEDNIDEQNCHHKIAPMLLIPFVENAFKHGISLQEKSWIKINLHCTEKDIRFEVHNSTHPKRENDPEKERSGIGFKNVLERLKLIYPGKFDISFNADEKEFFVKLSIQP